MRKFLAVLFAVLLALPVGGGHVYAASAAPPVRYVSYRDVPGVTQTEIDAIEKIKQSQSEFVVGMVLSTESFVGEDGNIHGFTALLCGWMTEMFGVTFLPKHYEWDALLAAMETGEVHFSGDLTATDERRKTYVMTSPIAERVNTFFKLDITPALARLNEEKTLNLGFLQGSSINDNFDASGRYQFQPFYYDTHARAAEALLSGEVDAIVDESVAQAAYAELTDRVVSEMLFPPSYSPVSLSTRDKTLSPFISVMQKVLDSEGEEIIAGLYDEGFTEYQRNEFFASLTQDELDYVNGRARIHVAAQYNDYPVSFYNEHDMEWQGIAQDVLAEITRLMGVEFRVLNRASDNMDTLGHLVNGDVAAVLAGASAEALSRMRLVASDKAIAADTYAFLSGTELDNIRLNEVLHMSVGLARDTAQEEMFNTWFPGHGHVSAYENWDDAYNALVNHEVELMLSGSNRLSYLVNYLEEVDYKVNLPMDYPFNSYFGFNADEPVVASVFNKALRYVDTDAIGEAWVRRSFDYAVQSAERQQIIILGVGGAAVLLVVVTIAIVLSGRQRKMLEKQVASRTEELEEQNTIITGILDCMPDMVFAKDKDMKYTRVNKSFEKFYGVLEKDILGKTVAALIPDKAISDLSDSHGFASVEKRQIVSAEESHVNSYSNIRILETVRAPLVRNNTVVGVVGIMHDITRLKDIERQAYEASNAKSAFLANMSHEIRTPMNSIVGFSELALDENLSPKARDYVSKIVENSDWLLQIINDILDISKIESGKMDLECIPFELHEVFTRCRDMIMPKALEKGVQLYCYAEPSVGRRLMGDPTRLKQSLINLLSNAVKFTNIGVVKMLSDIVETTEDTATVYFEVKDSGIGMTPEQAAKIFDPFTQADSGTTRKYGGTGLGLSITKNIVEMMGSKLEVSSVPNVGTKFSFTVTFKTMVVSEEQAQAEAALTEQKMPLFNGEVLLCEDNNMNQQVIVEHLRRVGLRTVVAGNGQIGLDAVNERVAAGKKPFDLIFMDIHMPVMDGIEASAAITKLNTGTPIVALTANMMTNETSIYKKNGMLDYLGKPFKSVELWRCLAKYFKPAGADDTGREEDEAGMGLQRKMRKIFAQDNRQRYREIVEALGTGDITLAHRLAHTLKGNAGMLDERGLQDAAKAVETALRDGQNNTSRRQMETLRTELDSVLHKLLPLLEEDAGDEAAEPPDSILAEPAEKAEGMRTVLAVDDERANLVALTHILNADYNVYTARGGKDALQKACDIKPDLILLDVLMPDMDGYEVITKLKDMQETKHIPVIFISGLGDAADEERGLALHAADYIPKPFSPAIVKLRVNNQMQIIEQMATIEKLSLLDQLTGIPNRRSFDGRFHAEWVRAIRDKTSLGVMIIDIDNFKKHNDTYGHQQGDRALQFVANAISGTLKRAGDYAARWGGEEFVILLPNTELDGAYNVAEKIRSNVAGLDILLEDGGVTHVTVSIGLSVIMPESADLTEAFITKADEALYEAKRTGKNKVCGE